MSADVFKYMPDFFYVVCLLGPLVYSNTCQTTFIMETKAMNDDQSNLGPYHLQTLSTKVQQIRKQTTCQEWWKNGLPFRPLVKSV